MSGHGVGEVERRTQRRVVKFLTDTLGFRYAGNLAKQNNSNIDVGVLKGYLRRAGYEEAVITRAVAELERTANDQTKSLYDRNRNVYTLLRYGVQVKPEHGVVKQTVHLINWDDPEANDFAVAEEVTVVPKKSGGNEKRPDVVVYLNGIAVVVLELKRSTVSVGEGIRQTLDNQKPTFIEEFFSTVAWVLAGNETEGLRYATIGTPEKYWLSWREDGQDAQSGDPLIDALGQILCKERFLELLHDYVIYDLGVKKLPRHHQYFAVKAAQSALQENRSGVIWASQGSGKSLIMVWLARWIRENIADSRVLIVTDRDELDAQIESVFEGVGERIYRTKSSAELLDVIAGSLKGQSGPAPAITCSLIHKFGSGTSDGENLTEEMLQRAAENIEPKGRFVVFVDEAHRTQSGKLHRAMRILLPDAVFIGFTGTPLLTADRTATIAMFGPYIYTYRYDQAVRDGVVLDLRYEARDVQQRVVSQANIDKWFDAKTAGLNDVAKSKLKQRWGTLQKMFSTRERLQVIVSDILMDFNIRPRLMSGRGNAILAASSVFEACRYYELFSKTELKGKVAIITSYDPSPSAIKGEEVGEGETDAIEKYDTYRRMLADWFSTDEDSAMRRKDEFERQAKDRFVHDPGQMNLLIVVDKLLTGFDAPPATYLYVDKTMQDHGLFQAICRVNRLDDDTDPADVKEYGYIVDYRDLFASLASAVKDYTGGAFEGYDQADVDGLLNDALKQAVEQLQDARDTVVSLCDPVKPPKGSSEYRAFFCPHQGDSDDQITAKERLRVTLYRAVGRYARAWAELAPDLEAAGITEAKATQITSEIKHYNAVKDEMMLASGDGIDLKAYEPGMRNLIDNFVKSDDSIVLSDLNNQSFLELLAADPAAAVAGLPGDLGTDQDSAQETIAANVRRVIVDANPTNPKYYGKMSELLEEIIEKRRQEVITYQQYLQEMSELAKNALDPANSGHYPPELTSPLERLIYDTLDEHIEATKTVADVYWHNAQDGWRGNNVKRKRLTRELRKAVTAAGIDPARTDTLMEVLAANADQ